MYCKGITIRLRPEEGEVKEKYMGIFKDAGDAFIKYGEILINKAEELARIAKLNLDIKHMQIDVGIAEKELGRYVLSTIESGASSIQATDPHVRKGIDKVKSLQAQIQEKKDEIEKIKAAAREKAAEKKSTAETKAPDSATEESRSSKTEDWNQ